jgi:hypothetical protein
MNPAAGWQHVATFEVDGDGPTLAAVSTLIGARAPDGCRIAPAREAPAGCRWFEVHADLGIGERRVVLIAMSLLGTLQQCADEGTLKGYHLVGGRDWLRVAIARERSDATADAEPWQR